MNNNRIIGICVLIGLIVFAMGACNLPEMTGDDYAKKGIRKYQNHGNVEYVERYLKKALKLGLKDADPAEVYKYLGSAYDDQKKPKEAEEAYKKSLSHNPNDHVVLSNLGLIYVKTHSDLKTGREYYEKALKIKPDYEFALCNMGALCFRQGENDQAIVYYEKAIANNPSMAVTHANVSLSYAMVGRFDDARKALKQSAALGYKKTKIIKERIDQLEKIAAE